MSTPTAPDPSLAGSDTAVEYMTPTPNTFACLLATPGTFPKINLLPPEIEERRSLRRLQAICVAALVLCMLAVGGLYYTQHSKIASAEANLEQVQAETVRLQGETKKLAYVTETQQALAAAQATVQAALGNDVQWSQYLNDLSRVIPEDVWLTQVNVTQNTDAGSATAGSAAAQAPNNGSLPNSLGTITMEGGALSWNGLAGWLDTLAKVKGFANPYLSTSQVDVLDGTPYIKYTISVQLTAEALSHRYTQAGG